MDATGTNTGRVSDIVLRLLPQETESLHLFSQGHVTQKRGCQALSQWQHCLRAPTTPWVDSSAPRDQTQPCFALQPQGGVAGSQREFFFFQSMFAV